MKSIRTAIKGKGFGNFVRRGVRIAERYGLTPKKMEQALSQFSAVLERFQCGATYPITAIALERNVHVIAKYLEQNIEFAVHGQRHVDHTILSRTEQLAQLDRARQIFTRAGIRFQGFRCPYLRGNVDTWASLQQLGFAYDSSQGLAWDIMDSDATPAYRQVLNFYGAKSANDYPSLPRIQGSLVRIPYSLPDDEALVERLNPETVGQMSALWLAILDRTYELGELFTLGLHPERIAFCQEPLIAVLDKARSLVPAVWIARLDEIGSWWRARSAAAVTVKETNDGAFHLRVTGPPGTAILVRGVDAVEPIESWTGGYVQVKGTACTLHCEKKPFIGVSPDSPLNMVAFLRQQGYIVDITTDRQSYTFYIDDTRFADEDQSSLLSQIETGQCALVRLGCWPFGARSALAVTGDIDALTIWDYGLRSFGR